MRLDEIIVIETFHFYDGINDRLAADIIMPWPLIQVHLQDFRSLSLPHKIEMLSRLMEVSTTAVKIRLEKK